MVIRPASINAYEFCVLSSLRAKQLMRGSLPRLAGLHKETTMAQMEVSGGQVQRASPDGEAAEVEAPSSSGTPSDS